MLDPTLILIGKIEIFLAVTESNGIRGGKYLLHKRQNTRRYQEAYSIHVIAERCFHFD